MANENVILVDESDNETGVMEKMQAHRTGALHRALSVCVFNSKGEWLLHRRAAGKYHSSSLWTNTCCSHPRPGENIMDAAHRRLREEMGLTCELEHRFSFRYHADLDNGLVEHELDHVFTGSTDAVPQPDPDEVSEWQYLSTDALRGMMKEHPGQFTEWFKLIFDKADGGRL